MTDDTETLEPEAAEEETTVEAPPARDDMKDELERLRGELAAERAAREQQLMSFMSHQAAPAPAAAPQRPDFSGLPNPTDDPDGYAAAYWSRLEAFTQSRAASVPAPMPSDEEIINQIVARTGAEVDRDAAEGAIRRAAREMAREGINLQQAFVPGSPLRPIVERRLETAVKMKVTKVEPSRTAGTGGGSVPSKPATAAKDPRVKSTYEIMRADQKKRGLY